MRRAFALAMLLLVATCGCSSLSGGPSSFFKKKMVVADAQNPAVEVACIWQPAEGRTPNGVPARGFSGQVLFFTRNDPEPALVDGTVRVYLFADRGTQEERGKPLKEYDFTPQEWSAHATMTSLGPGYSVFVPYPDPEAYQVRCQLRVRFVPKEGPVVWSEALTMILEGPPRPGNEPNSWATAEAQALVGHRNEIEINKRSSSSAQLKKGEDQRTLRSDTFSLPDLQKAVYEAPDRPTRPRSIATASATVVEPELISPPLSVEQPPQSTTSESPTRRSTSRSAKAHPLENMMEAPARPTQSRHPLTRENSAALEKSPRFLLSHPLHTSGAHEDSGEASAQPMQAATDAQAARLLAAGPEARAAILKRHAGAVDPAAGISDATPVYGAWQSMRSSTP